MTIAAGPVPTDLTKPGRLHVVCEGRLYRVYAHAGENREIERIADGATAFLHAGEELARWEADWAFADHPDATDTACDAYAHLLDRME
ncbi:MAG: hypothetical protein WDN04_04370 [Rhodospirillales bacterium]